MKAVRVAIVGDFDRRKHSHWATEAALFHAAARVGVRVEPHWMATTTVARSEPARALGGFDAIWGAPGSPYATVDGILRAIEYARENDVAFLGTCGGCQYALIEFSRNVLGIGDADTAENDPGGKNVVITPVSCSATSLSVTSPSATSPSTMSPSATSPIATSPTPRLAGPGVAQPLPGTVLEALCGAGNMAEEYFCNFEINAAFVPRWMEAGLVIAARGADGEVRAVELPGKRFFMATLFQPQLSSSYERPHPIVEGLLRASTNQEVEETDG